MIYAQPFLIQLRGEKGASTPYIVDWGEGESTVHHPVEGAEGEGEYTPYTVQWG
jgi:hypothetical protein